VRIRGSLFFRDEERAMQPVYQRLAELGIPAELGPEHEVVGSVVDAVTERVIRRAEELRTQWRANPSPLGEDAIVRRTWRRKSVGASDA
jgi:hypothetical protein